MNEGELTVLVASEYEIIRCGFATILGRCENAVQVQDQESVESLERRCPSLPVPNLIVLDLDMPGADTDLLRRMRVDFPSAKLVAVAGHLSRTETLDALEAGAHGVITKSASADAVASALRRVLAGHIYVPTFVADQPCAAPLACERRPANPANCLTARQAEVLQLIRQGQSNKQIAYALHLAEGTVKNHVSVLMRTLGVHNRAGAAMAGMATTGEDRPS